MTHMTTISPDRLMQLGTGFWVSKVLLSAVEVGLFTELAKSGPLGLEELRTRLGLHRRSARDFFDALVSVGIVERLEDGRYANSPETDLYLDRAKPTYIGGILEMANKRLYPFWGRLTDGLRTGEPQNEIRDGGNDLFEAVYADPENLKTFLGAMTGISIPTARAIAAAFPWSEYKTFADVGCAQGGLPVEVARAHPHLTGLGFDLPPVRPIFEEYVARNGLAERLTFQPGNFFADPLPTTDVLVMGHILHDWGLDDKLLLLRKAYEALPTDGALIVYDGMIDDERRTNTFGLLMSLNMLIETNEGFDYTGADCVGWMRDTGFRNVRVQHLQGPYSMVVGWK